MEFNKEIAQVRFQKVTNRVFAQEIDSSVSLSERDKDLFSRYYLFLSGRSFLSDFEQVKPKALECYTSLIIEGHRCFMGEYLSQLNPYAFQVLSSITGYLLKLKSCSELFQKEPTVFERFQSFHAVKGKDMLLSELLFTSNMTNIVYELLPSEVQERAGQLVNKLLLRVLTVVQLKDVIAEATLALSMASGSKPHQSAMNYLVSVMGTLEKEHNQLKQQVLEFIEMLNKCPNENWTQIKV